jgi:hypothetical protein
LLRVLVGRRRALVAALMRLQLSKGKKEREERKGGSNNGMAAQPSGSGAASLALLRSPAKNRSRLFSPTAFAGRFFAAPSAWSLPCFGSRTARRFCRCKVSQRLAMKRNANAARQSAAPGAATVAALRQRRRAATQAGETLRRAQLSGSFSGWSLLQHPAPAGRRSRCAASAAGATRRQVESASRARHRAQCRRAVAPKKREKTSKNF